MAFHPPTEITEQRDRAIAEIGEDAVYDMVAAGMRLKDIASELGMGDSAVAAERVRDWLRRDEDRYEQAKRRSVEALAEKAGEVYGDERPRDTADAKWRNDRSGYYRWLAEMRAGFKRNGVEVNVDLGSLHLDALRQAGRMNSLLDEPEPPEIPAEVLDEDD